MQISPSCAIWEQQSQHPGLCPIRRPFLPAALCEPLPPEHGEAPREPFTAISSSSSSGSTPPLPSSPSPSLFFFFFLKMLWKLLSPPFPPQHPAVNFKGRELSAGSPFFHGPMRFRGGGRAAMRYRGGGHSASGSALSVPVGLRDHNAGDQTALYCPT